jgi:hypothetical protein
MDANINICGLRLRSKGSCRSARISCYVQQLQTNPGSVIQLNMGLGKTRVLVPMLILDLMSSRRTGRVRMPVDHRRSYGLLQDRSCFICTCETLFYSSSVAFLGRNAGTSAVG